MDKNTTDPMLRPAGTNHAVEPVREGSVREGPAREGLSPIQQALPFDDEADRPVAFSLTARAKRAVAPQDLPALSLVRDRVRSSAQGGVAAPNKDGWPSTDDPSDTRPSRARALKRAGLSAGVIATQLHVDPLLVRAWVGPSPQATDRPPVARDGDGPVGSSSDAGQEEAKTAFGLARAQAEQDARRTRLRDPKFAAGLGLVASIMEVDTHAVTVTTGDQDVVAAILQWLDDQLPIDPARVRIVLRVGARAAGDLVAHRWAATLGIARDRVAVARWHGAPDDRAVQALLRVADPVVAASVAGWRDALLAPLGPNPADVAF